MPAIIEPVAPAARDAPPPPLGRRLLWFAGLSLGGLGATAGAACLLHLLLFMH